MNRTIIVLVFLLIFNITYSQDFKVKIIYEATLDNEDFYNRLIKDTTITEVSKNAKLNDITSTSPINFHLIINGNEALYQAEYDIEARIRLGFKPNRTNVVAQDFYIYYTNKQTNEKFFQNFFTKEVLVDLDEIDWVLTQETKNIGKYKCYKATATIDAEQLYGMNFMGPIVAWYTPQIPVSFGIKEFNGLPGLTLELISDYEKGKVFYKATKIELNPEEDIKIKKPEGKRHISEQEYVELIKKLNNNRRLKRNDN